MAVTLTWFEWNNTQTEGNHVGTEVSTLNFGNTDSADLTPASYPISAGSNSYTKYFKVNFSGSFTQISNGKFYKSSGDYKTGESILFSGSYAKPGSPSTSDLGVDAVPVSLPGSNNVILGGATTDGTLPRGGESESSPGYYSGSRTDMMAIQLQTTGSTPAGALNQKTFTLQYDYQ